ncbi:MAG: hypothetical protein ACI82G_000912 [Bradymonadia bacterium]|jgi:hypothetical protein
MSELARILAERRLAASGASDDGSLLATVAQHIEVELRRSAAEFCAPCASVSPFERGTVTSARGRAVPVLWGSIASLYVPTSRGLKTLRVRYALVDEGDVIASHDPISFEATAEYPQELQERDYTNDASEQLKVRSQESGFEAALVANSNPDAVNGPPVVDPALLVLGGNSRAMTVQRVMRNEPARYTTFLASALRSHCSSLGLDGVSGDELAGKMLIRVIQDEGAIDRKSISALLNRSLTQSMQRAAGAVSLGARLPVELIKLLATQLDEQGTLAEVVSRSERSVVKMLRRADIITSRNQSTYVVERRGREALTRAGRDLVVDAILGAVVGDKALLAQLEGRTVIALERAAPVLLAIEAATAGEGGQFEFGLLEDVRAALRAWVPIQGASEAEWRAHWGNGTLFDPGGAPDIKASAAAMLHWWWANHRRPAQLAKALLEYYRAIPAQFRGEPGLFALSAAEVRSGKLDGPGLREFALAIPRAHTIERGADYLAKGGTP